MSVDTLTSDPETSTYHYPPVKRIDGRNYDAAYFSDTQNNCLSLSTTSYSVITLVSGLLALHACVRVEPDKEFIELASGKAGDLVTLSQPRLQVRVDNQSRTSVGSVNCGQAGELLPLRQPLLHAHCAGRVREHRLSSGHQVGKPNFL